jgi:chromosome partitioning protein
MLSVISLVSQKGGVGKSSIAINLAVLAATDIKTCIIDCDPQGTCVAWYESRANQDPAIIPADQVGFLPETLSRLDAAGFDLAVIDTAGSDAPATREAMRVADFCLVPLRPSRPDLMATVPTVEALRALDRQFNLVLSQAPSNPQSRVSQAVQRRLESSASFAPVILVSRMDWQHSYALGQSVTEYAPTSRAAVEVAELWSWTKRQLEASHGQEKRRA